MRIDELSAVLESHRMWLEGREGGKCADLDGANLRWANLRGANLHGANLREADLHGANLQEANLRGANLHVANLHGANLQEANLDFASWPLWCGTRGVRVDVRIFRQIAMHLCGVVVDDDECRAAQAALMPLARQCHRADEFFGEGQK